MLRCAQHDIRSCGGFDVLSYAARLKPSPLRGRWREATDEVLDLYGLSNLPLRQLSTSSVRHQIYNLLSDSFPSKGKPLHVLKGKISTQVQASISANETVNVFTNAGKPFINIRVGVTLYSQTKAAQVSITL